jgi:hypothetical protein
MLNCRGGYIGRSIEESITTKAMGDESKIGIKMTLAEGVTFILSDYKDSVNGCEFACGVRRMRLL